ncbi:hypothetical protein H5410_000565 [Solanum commersonii]|uniref:KIB1-4 beta-propeller domain-containing protein n=1 Tax=Solanum commersonii TaxID=4109 RepID=A0A9J6AWJ2_SOLCO|nr:hypothetical protein H5410_000565 [Solanum commersonii]
MLEEMKVEEKKNDGPPLSSQPCPWLVICPLRKKPQTFFSLSEDRSYKRSIHEFCSAIIRASAQEWLVLEDFDSTDCYLWNPISNDKIQLPPLPNNDKLLCLLSAPPNDPRWRFLCINMADTTNSTRLDVDDSSGTISATPMTNQPPYDHFTELLDMPYSRVTSFNHHLMTTRKRTHVDVYKITVFRFDFVKAVWEEVKSIGETAIFLDNSYGGTTCCTRGTHIKKESIYFTEGVISIVSIWKHRAYQYPFLAQRFW